MNSETLKLLCDPDTHDDLQLHTAGKTPSELREYLLNPKTGHHFPVREGIPVFLLDKEITGSNLRYRKMYDRFAPFYDFSTWAYSVWKGMTVKNRLWEYLDELEIHPGDRVLEVSVGTGRNLKYLPRDAQYFGLDISWGMLRQCRRNTARWKMNAQLFLGSAENLPFRDEVFDVVFHFGGINFFNDRAAAVREMIRVARPGTRFVIGDENEDLAKKYEKYPVTGGFYGDRQQVITAPVDLLPPGMQEVKVKDIAGGDLYYLSFRKPRASA